VNGGEKDAEEEEEGVGGGEGKRLTCSGSQCCWRRWRWQDVATGDGGGVSDDGSHRFFPVFSSRLLFFSTLGSLLSIPILLLSSFSLFLFIVFFFFFPVFLLFFLCFFFSFSLSVFCSLLYFFLFFPVLYPPFFFSTLSSPIFIGKTGEREAGATTMQPAQKQPEGHIPSFFHRPLIGHRSEVIQVGLWSVSFLCFLEKEGEKSW
jgi:hypothetical protein